MNRDALGAQIGEFATELRRTLFASPEERLLAAVIWDIPSLARRGVFEKIIGDLRWGAEVLSVPASNYRRAGYELALALRKLTEHLAIVINFAERDYYPDYSLWVAITRHERGNQLVSRIQKVFESPVDRQELWWTLARTKTMDELRHQVTADFAPGTQSPWFLKPSGWDKLFGAGPEVLGRSDLRTSAASTLNRARAVGSALERMVLGHYGLTYGQYSEDIHATAPDGNDIWDNTNWELLALVLILLCQRIAGLQGVELKTALHSASSIERELAADFRMGRAPQVGEAVEIGTFGSGEVREVSADQALARVLREEGFQEIRPCLKLFS